LARLSPFGGGKLADVRVFKKADGLTWLDSAGSTFTLSWSELRDWVGVRAQGGCIVPKGFPRSNSFGPAF
jgi:topoisomerase-4 subunit A